MKVSVAILSWNGRRHLETCLEALAAQRDPGVGWEILVLDNGSTDGTADWIRQEIAPRDRMTYGQSVTDACIHWDDTVALLRGLAGGVQQRRRRRAANQ